MKNRIRWPGILTVLAGGVASLTVCPSCVQDRSQFALRPIVNTGKRDAPNNLYEEVVGAVTDTDAHIIASLKEGTVALNGGTRLYVPASCDAGADVHIVGRALDSASVEFTRALRVEPIPGVPLRFRHLTVASNGEVDPVDIEFVDPLHRALLSGELPKIRRRFAEAVALNTDVYAMLTKGRVFAEHRSRETEPTSASMCVMSVAETHANDGAVVGMSEPVTSINSLLDRLTISVNMAKLRPGTAFLFNDYDQPAHAGRTRVVVGPESSVAIPFAELNPSTGLVDATIDLTLNTLDSAIYTAGQRFELGSGSHLIATGLSFHKDAGGWTFASARGYAELTLKTGSMALEGSSLELSRGSTVSLYDFSLSSQRCGPLVLGGSGKVTLNIDSGLLHFNTLPSQNDKPNMLVVGPASKVVVEGDIELVSQDDHATWRVKNGKARLDVNVEEGLFDMGTAGLAHCGTGTHLLASAVDFDTTRARNCTGKIDLVDIQNIRATVTGSQLASTVNVNRESFLLLGDRSTLVITNAIIGGESSTIVGTLSGTLKAVGGTLKIGSSTIIVAERGSNVEASGLILDSRSHGFLSGRLASVSLATQSTNITVGSFIRGLALAPDSTAIISPMEIDAADGRIHGLLSVNAKAEGGGSLAVGPGATLLPIGVGTHLYATGLTVDSNASAPVRGVIQGASVATSGGQIDLAALSGGGGSGFVGVSGTVSLSNVQFPSNEDGATGMAVLGGDSAQDTMTFSGGTWSLGAASLQLLAGRVRGPLEWSRNNGRTSFTFHPTIVESELATEVASTARRIGSWNGDTPEPEKVPCVLATGTLSVSGAHARFKIRCEATELSGQFVAPFVDRLNSRMTVECVDAMNLDIGLSGQIYIPCDGDDEEDGRKAYPESLSVAMAVSPGWRLTGGLLYDRLAGTQSMTLADSTGAPTRVSISNKSDVRLVDGRGMVDVCGCARVTIHWHKGYTWQFALSGFRGTFVDGRLRIGADLLKSENLTVKKDAPSDFGLRWNGSPCVEDLDVLVKVLGYGSVSEAINGIIDQKVLPAVRAKLSEIDFVLKK
jgi:hypothetical protein